MTLQINHKFKELLPSLSDEEDAQLETSLLNEGCREVILVWRNQIVDGHNRHRLCEKHGIPYRINEMPFADEPEVLEWIYTNQLGRRNLSENQKTHYIGELYNLRKSRHGGDRKSSGNSCHLILNEAIVTEDWNSHTVTEFQDCNTEPAGAKNHPFQDDGNLSSFRV